MPKDKRLYMTFPIDFADHPTIVALSNEACWLYIAAIGWSAGNGQRYWISRTTRLDLRASKRAADELAQAGLWLADTVEGVTGHWIVKNGLWAVHQTHREKISAEVREFVLERDGHRCVSCGATERLQMDHVFPWSLGGGSHPENLQALCAPCNQTKGAKI